MVYGLRCFSKVALCAAFGATTQKLGNLKSSFYTIPKNAPNASAVLINALKMLSVLKNQTYSMTAQNVQPVEAVLKPALAAQKKFAARDFQLLTFLI